MTRIPELPPPTPKQQQDFEQQVITPKTLVLPLEALGKWKKVEWNYFWQLSFDSVVESKIEMAERYEKQVELLGCFSVYCNSVSRALIEDLESPSDRKRIPQSRIGGAAGGEKYVYGSVIFKFARG